jgi:7-cyano-7-deazaguanine synthase in queuosine biosynthesis
MLKENSIKKKVLLFSGGMDSIMGWKLLNPDILLYIRIGSRYEDKEIRWCNELKAKYNAPIIFDNRLSLKDKEREDLIIPLRNLFFISIASYYGDTIYLGAMAGDRVLDKSIEFTNNMSSILTYLYQKQHWCKERNIQVKALYDKKMTKTQLVKIYKKKGYDLDLLRNSLSCYSEEEGHCGWCKPCFRKWVSFKNNGLETAFFKKDPSKYPLIASMLRDIKEGKQGYRGQEDIDILKALGA